MKAKQKKKTIPPKIPTVRDYCWDDEGKLGPIPPTIQVGIQWKSSETGNVLETDIDPKSQYHYRNGKRIARLKLSSFIGCIGAMHHYAKLEGTFIGYRDTVTGKQWSGSHYGGPEENLCRLVVEVKRRLTKVEKDMNDEPLGKIGELTYRFDTEKQAEAHAIKVFKKRFAPGWILLSDNIPDGKEDYAVLAET